MLDNFATQYHLFSTLAKFSEKLVFLIPPYAHVRVRIRGVRKIRFLENFAYGKSELIPAR